MAGSFDPVSTFLSIVEPWSPNTYVNIEAFEWTPAKNGAASGTLSPRGSRAARDVAEAANFARWQSGLGREVYIRMATHRQPGTAKTAKNGTVYHRALGGRANAVALKSFFIDVDVKPGAHSSTQEAIQSVVAMCGAIGLPRPSIIVYSGGGGFHAHWVTTQPVPVADWHPIARQLAEACRVHGVHADHNLTVNAVCLLRIPGTNNGKYGAPRPVLLDPSMAPAVDIEVIKSALAPFSPVTTQNSPGNSSITPTQRGPNDSWDLSKFPVLTPVSVSDQFLAGLSAEPYTLEEVAVGCPLVRDALATGGKDHREPLWFALGHVAVFTAGEAKDFHRLSSGHGNYSPADTDEKFARILENKVANDQGWPRCTTLQNAGSSFCAACPNWANAKSPLNFAARAQVTQPSNHPQPPVNTGGNVPTVTYVTLPVDGYLDDPATGLYSYEKLDKKGMPFTVQLWSYPMWNLDLKEDDTGRFAVHFDTKMAKHRQVHVTIPTSELRNGDTMRGCLTGRYALGILDTETKGLLNFMASFKSQMRERANTVTRQELMGWTDVDGKPTGFIYGPTKYNCAGNTPFNQPNAMIREQYFPTGSIEPWMEAIHMINAEQRPEMDMLVATAFGAPLMRFTGEKGVVVSAYSSATAVHKTTAIKVGQATWGAAKGINQLGDTMNNVMEWVGKTRIVPTYFDEMKSSSDVKRWASMVFTFTGGKGKGRLNRNAEIKDVATWDTLLVGVSNDSLFDHIANHDKGTDAGVARVFEFEINAPDPSSPGQISMGKAGEILRKLEANYGKAGERYAEHLGQSVEWLPQTVTDTIGTLQRQLNAPSSERFWVSAAAVLLIGAQMANDINLTRFDLGRMRDLITKTFTRMRTAKIAGDLDISKKGSTLSFLSTYVNTHRRSTIATDVVGTPGRVGALTPVTIFNHADIHLVNEFSIRFIRDPSPVLRISKGALSKWLKDFAIAPGVFTRNLMDQYQAKEVYTSIVSGTNFPGARERVIELDLNHPDLVNLYEI